MPHRPVDLTRYVLQESVRRRFIKHIGFCEHGKRCKKCHWLWKGSTNSTDYGRFYVGVLSYEPYKRLYVNPSRFMYVLMYGDTEHFVLHTCDIPACVNFNHLYAGSQGDNVQDMIRKGRANFFGNR